jgi:hypothetical protein
MSEPIGGSHEVVAFGIRVTGLPLDPWQPPATPYPAHASVAWRANRSPVQGATAGWARGDAESVTAGWGSFAEYRLRTHPPIVDANLDAISPLDAVLALLLSVMPMTLPLFELEPFHGSAVRAQDGALMFLGGRGDGKSSTAAAMHSMGYEAMTDDACALDAGGMLWPGPPLLSPRDDRAEPPTVGRYNQKFLRTVGDVGGDPAEVKQVFVLRPLPGEELDIRSLTATEAFPAVIAQSRTPMFLADVRRAQQLRLAALLSRIGVHEIRYDPERCSFLDVGGEVANLMGVGAT